MMSEHVPTGRPTPGRMCGMHSMSEYAPSDRPTASGACRIHSFRIPVIRVQRRVQGWQFSHSHQSGVPSAGVLYHRISVLNIHKAHRRGDARGKGKPLFRRPAGAIKERPAKRIPRQKGASIRKQILPLFFLLGRFPMRAGGMGCLPLFTAGVDAMPIAQRVVSPPCLADVVQAEMCAVAASAFFHRFALLLKIAAALPTSYRCFDGFLRRYFIYIFMITDKNSFLYPIARTVKTVGSAHGAGNQFAREQMLAQNVLARYASAEDTPE